MLRFIAVFKFCKALLLVVVGLGALRLLDPSVAARAQRWVAALASSNDRSAVLHVIALVAGLSPRRLEAVGAGVTSFKVGDRAGVPWIYSTCGACEYCASDREPLCPSIVVTGFMVDGGFAEYVKAPASHAVAVPPELGFVDAAPVYCAALTSYRALKVSGARLGDTVAVWGVGGLGHYAVQIARASGARVVAVDIQTTKLDLARQLGADVTVDASREKPEDVMRELGGAHVVVNFAPTAEAIAQGFRALRRGGTLVLVGLPSGDFTLPIRGSVAKGIRILTSAVGTRQDLREVLALGWEDFKAVPSHAIVLCLIYAAVPDQRGVRPDARGADHGARRSGDVTFALLKGR